MIVDKLKFKGTVNFLLTDEQGNVKEDKTVENLVVNIGKDFITNRMIGTGKGVMSYMGVGTSSTAAAGSQTDLVTPVVRSNTSFSATQSTTTTANDTVTYSCTFGTGVGTGALTEAGIFNAASAGDMLCRTVFSVINKGANDSLVITWKVTAA